METTSDSGATTSKYGRRYSPSEREALLARFRESGQRLRAFARSADVSETALKRWMGGGSRRQGGPKLVAVRVKEAESISGAIEVRFGCGATLRAPAAALAEVVGILRRPC
jgi:transposase-like protein